ncbi:MAG: hypothetical protein JWQ84_2725 [Mucilaginibacter sp.]|nr:hypothetical protein [Mucilaginibacter sp.]
MNFIFPNTLKTAFRKYKPTSGREGKRYTTFGISYIIHTFSSPIKLLCSRCLKKEGVTPVTFLNWVDKWATLL